MLVESSRVCFLVKLALSRDWLLEIIGAILFVRTLYKECRSLTFWTQLILILQMRQAGSTGKSNTPKEGQAG